MRCLNCGEAFDGVKKVCHTCGTKVIEEIPPPPKPVVEIIKDAKKRPAKTNKEKK
jgi:predicted  nucleic acid-binding Zn-ribbon protein